MRRASFTPAFKVSVDEPLIVVDESEELENEPTSPRSIEEEVDEDKESPDNPYLLSPFRDPRETRKHSLPNIQCTSGIMASQVRRLSDGGDNAPNANEMAFLAKLSQVIQSITDFIQYSYIETKFSHKNFPRQCESFRSKRERVFELKSIQFIFLIFRLGVYIVRSTTFGCDNISGTSNSFWPQQTRVNCCFRLVWRCVSSIKSIEIICH